MYPNPLLKKSDIYIQLARAPGGAKMVLINTVLINTEEGGRINKKPY